MKKIIIALFFILLLTSCGSSKPQISNTSATTESDSNELTPHNKELTEMAVKTIDDYLNGKETKEDTNDKLITLFKGYEIKGRLIDADVAECALYVIDNDIDKIISTRDKLAALVDMENYVPPKKLSNEDIDAIIDITNGYLLGKYTNDQAKTKLLKLYSELEENGVVLSDDMTILFAIISTSEDPQKDKKEIMKYRNNIAILKEN